MDSLIASYASSDDEDESPPQQKQQHNRVQFPPNSAIDEEPQAAPDNDDDVSESKLRAHDKPFSSFLSLPKPKSNPSFSPSSVFASLPRPQSSSSESVSLFSSLSPPGSSSVSARVPIRGDSNSRFGTIHVDGIDDEEEDSYGQSSSLPKVSSKLFSALLRPKSRAGEDGILNLGLVERNGKKVVQFRPPIGMALTKKYEYDDDEEEEEERKQPQEIPHSASVKSFLSSIPAPKNSSTLGVLPSSTSGHRLVVEEKKTSESLDDSRREKEVAADDNIPSDQGVIVDGSKQSNSYSVNWAPVEQNYAGYESYAGHHGVESYADHHGVESYADHHGVESYGTHQGSWDYGASVGMASETPLAAVSFIKAAGKRGRDKVPTEIVEVKQDELIKDRLREDQVKLTGIAFGPAYQPASSKMKPSKLHKRKHQIGSLFYDMKQKEMELAERRAKGFLTKAETQAKYGW